MKIHRSSFTALSLCAFLLSSLAAQAADRSALVDDFSNDHETSVGTTRMVVTDTTAGGGSTVKETFNNGVMTAEGTISPARGQPGWVSTVLLLKPQNEPVDISRFEGVRLMVHVRKGTLAVTANSTDITNFDYHSALVPKGPGELQEVKIPFTSMKRAWSEQTPLNRSAVGSVALVAVDMQKGEFAYDIDEIGFY